MIRARDILKTIVTFVDNHHEPKVVVSGCGRSSYREGIRHTEWASESPHTLGDELDRITASRCQPPSSSSLEDFCGELWEADVHELPRHRLQQ